MTFVRKPKGFEAKRRAAKRRRLDTAELVEMQKARQRDEYCRFPLCGCDRRAPYGPSIQQVSHQTHRGMGGDPTGERTQSSNLLLLCNWRHKLAKFSVDQKTIRWVPLTDAGADGPIRWEIATAGLLDSWFPLGVKPEWFTLAVETAPHEYESLDHVQRSILSGLAEMTY